MTTEVTNFYISCRLCKRDAWLKKMNHHVCVFCRASFDNALKPDNGQFRIATEAEIRDADELESKEWVSER